MLKKRDGQKGVTVWLDTDLYSRFKIFCFRLGVPMGDTIGSMIKTFLEDEDADRSGQDQKGGIESQTKS